MKSNNSFAIIDSIAHALIALLIVLALAACGGSGGSDAADTTVARIEVDRQNLLLTAPGQQHQLSVRAFNAGGAPVDAKVVWTSSAPDQVSVDANGKVRSVTPIGSAQIVAEAGGVRSRPVLVASAELYPGTLLVPDAAVVRIDPPPAPSPGAPDDAPILYDAWLSGVQPPATGTIVLGSETAAVAGRVVETEVVGSQLRVRLQVLNLPDLLARYDINWVIDLTAYEMVWDPSASATGQQRPLAARERRLDETEVRLPDMTFPPGSPKPICEVSASAKLKTSPVKAKFGGSPKVEIISSRLQSGLPPGRLRIALVGDFKLETEVGLMVEAGLTGEVKCALRGASIPIPLFAAVGLSIPVGIGAKVKGELELASLEIGLAGETGAKFELGIDCAPPGPCVGLNTAEAINEFKPNLKISDPGIDGLKVKLEGSAYLITGLDVVLLGKLVTFNVLAATAGPKQTADFGTLKRQATDLPYASDYKLKFAIDISPGNSLKKAIEQLTGTEGDNFSFTLPIEADVSESPNGTWSADKTTAIPRRDTVKFAIDLKPISTSYFMLGYNVEAIEIHRRHESEIEFQRVYNTGASEPRAHFEWEWTPTEADAGKNEFVVFAVSKLPVVRLEVGTLKAVQVSCIAGTGPQRAGRERPLAAGVCKEEWVGTASGEITGAQRFKLQDNFIWEQDLTTVLGPNISALRPKKGARLVEVKQTVYENLGCTVSPERFDEYQTALMAVDRNFDPPKYAFSLQVSAMLTISCPNSPPLTIPTTALSISGLGELTEKGTAIVGSVVTPQSSYNWRFQLKVDEPQASAAATADAR